MADFPTVALEAFQMTLPPEGPRTVPVNVDMQTNVEHEIDISQMQGDGTISYISGAWIDNVGNDQVVTLTCDGTKQRTIIPANSQGWYSLMATNPPKFTATQEASGLFVRFIFVNFPVWPFVREASESPTPPLPTPGPTIASDVFTLDGTSQEIVAAESASLYFLVQNPLANGPIIVNVGGGDALTVGFVVQGGGSLELQNGTASAITISGTDTEEVTFAIGAA